MVNKVVLNNEPVSDTCTFDGVRHSVWAMGVEDSQRVSELFYSVDSMYIADGHHRAASATNLAT